MPNWCSNRLYVDGDEVEINRFLATVRNDENQIEMAERLLPMPEGIEDIRDWQINNWGCKWGDCDTRIDERWDGHIELEFESPWGPPTEVAIEIARRFPGLGIELYFEEPGNCVDGRIIAGEGKYCMEMKEYCSFREGQL